MQIVDKKRILIAPLDWGLGHATRCIPIISKLLDLGHDVTIAGNEKIKALLKREFPELPFIPLTGYNIQYGGKRWGLMVNMFFQIPKIVSAIRQENLWLKKVVDQYQFDVVISDNRYGLHHPEVHSVFITHQLLIRSPFFERLLQKINYNYINCFHRCWIPDFERAPSLAGILSHPTQLPNIPVNYIGPLSRFSYTAQEKDKKHLLILLSGPEPQRTLLEEKLLAQLDDFPGPIVFVRGLPGETSLPSAKRTVQIINHLPAVELQAAIEGAFLVIARSGYSTVMDLIALQQKSILIPTPGQTEQEYLAEHLMENGLAYCTPQHLFSLAKAIAESNAFAYQFLNKSSSDLLQQGIENMIANSAAVNHEVYSKLP